MHYSDVCWFYSVRLKYLVSWVTAILYSSMVQLQNNQIIALWQVTTLCYRSSVCLSICLFVCLSVTLVVAVKVVEQVIKLFTVPDTHVILHCEPKNTPKCFLSYLLQIPTNSDKICRMLSWVNLSHRNVNVFHFTWIMFLHYLVKLSIHVLLVNNSWNCKPKVTPKSFCHIFYKTRPILVNFGTYIFSWLNLP